MRIALFSDIHGNREALDACLAHARKSGIDRIVFLGDLVGYGADPGYVVDRVRECVERGALALLGNHDAAILSSAAGMNESARAAIDWTRRALDAAQRQFLASLPLTAAEPPVLFVHASARDPGSWRYVIDEMEAALCFAATEARIVFCGHTHVPALFHAAGGRVGRFRPVAGAAMPLNAPRRWLAVLGAVGQPRDRDPAACYGLFDDARLELSYVRVPYDVERAAAKIRAAGLPPFLAERLFRGV